MMAAGLIDDPKQRETYVRAARVYNHRIVRLKREARIEIQNAGAAEGRDGL